MSRPIVLVALALSATVALLVYVSSRLPFTKIDFGSGVELKPNSPEWPFANREFPGNKNPRQIIWIRKQDLNDDGNAEILFYVTGTMSCGVHNCDLRIYSDVGRDRELIFEAATGPVMYILSTKTQGFHDLAIPSDVPGVTDRTIWHWNGLRYVAEEQTR